MGDRAGRHVPGSGALVNFGEYASELRLTLREMNDGRNLVRYNTDTGERLGGCFDVISFGGKDADLDPEGCCGIEEVKVDESGITAIVQGHKSFCYDSDWTDKQQEVAHEVLCFEALTDLGAVSGDSESFDVSVRESLFIPWDDIYCPRDHIRRVAEVVAERAEKLCYEWGKSWSKTEDNVTKAIDEVAE